MAKFGSLPAMALAGGLASASPESADAQATEVMLPHPDGEIIVDVSQVAFETQVQILDHLQACLQEGWAYADYNEDGAVIVDGQVFAPSAVSDVSLENMSKEVRAENEQEGWDWQDEQAYCAETAELEFRSADAQTRSDAAQAETRRIQEEIDAMTDDLIAGS